MFSALTGEFRELLQTVLDNQVEMAKEMKDQKEQIEKMRKKMNKVNEVMMSGMRALQVAFNQIKDVAEYLDESVCEGLGRMSHVNLDGSLL